MPPTSVDHLTTTMTNYKQLCAELIDDLELCDWPYKLKETIRADIDRVRAALAEPEQEIYYEFSVLNDEYCTEAGGTAPTLQQALDEGRRYFAEYSQDGNYTLEVRRVEVIPIDRARAALAESEPEVPTDAELLQVFDTACLSEGGMVDEIHLRGLRAVLARWGNHPGSPDSSPQPVPVSECLPRLEDCDAEGRCWLCGKVEGDWRLINPSKSGVPQLKYCFSHWLPAHALPQPS